MEESNQMKRATQKEILCRRIDMLYYNRLGAEPKEWIPIIASKHCVSEESLRRDWSKRKDWMPQFLKLNEAKELMQDILFDTDKVILDAYSVYDGTDDVKAKVQLLWLRMGAIQRRKDLLSELGAFESLRSDFRDKSSDYQKKKEWRRLEERYPELKEIEDIVKKEHKLNKIEAMENFSRMANSL